MRKNLARTAALAAMAMVGASVNIPMANGASIYGTPDYFPRRKKFKGWQRELRRSTFNKNKR